MPLTHSKPGTPGFSRNVAEMVKSGHPQNQAVAAAYSAARTKDAMPASVRVLNGSDPGGDQELVAVPPHRLAASVGTANPAGQPGYTEMKEPYPQAPSPAMVTKSVYPQPRYPIPVVGGEETAVKDAAMQPGIQPDEPIPVRDDGGEMGETMATAEGGLGTGGFPEGPTTDEHVGFKAIEKKAAAEYGSEEAGKRVAAAIGREKYGEKGLEAKAEAGKK